MGGFVIILLPLMLLRCQMADFCGRGRLPLKDSALFPGQLYAPHILNAVDLCITWIPFIFQNSLKTNNGPVINIIPTSTYWIGVIRFFANNCMFPLSDAASMLSSPIANCMI